MASMTEPPTFRSLVVNMTPSTSKLYVSITPWARRHHLSVPPRKILGKGRDHEDLQRRPLPMYRHAVVGIRPRGKAPERRRAPRSPRPVRLTTNVNNGRRGAVTCPTISPV